MGVLFGLFVLVVLIIGLVGRNRQKKKWVREERLDESGAWIDKRPGERGTYGSLDEERELERRNLSRQGRINDLALLLRTYVLERHTGFHDLSDAQIKAFHVFAREQAGQIVATIEQIKTGSLPEPPQTLREDPQVLGLKKEIMDFAYRNFPYLLDLDLEMIRQFDRLAENWAAGVIAHL